MDWPILSLFCFKILSLTMLGTSLIAVVCQVLLLQGTGKGKHKECPKDFPWSVLILQFACDGSFFQGLQSWPWLLCKKYREERDCHGKSWSRFVCAFKLQNGFFVHMDGSDKKAFFILCIVNTVFDIPDCVVQYASAYAEDLHNYFHEFVDSARDCAKYAKTINGSLFWSWNHQNKACYPKTSNSDKKPAPPSGATSGTVECWRGPCKDCQIFEVAICMQCIICTGNLCSLGTFF